MNDLSMSIWWVLLIVGVVGSAVYSGLETGAYCINRVRLQILDHRKHRAARQLHRLIHQPTVLLGTLLLGNNITNYLGTASLTVILEDRGYSQWQVVVVNVLLITPLLLIFGETLPKDLFSAHSDRLMYRFAWFLELSRRVFVYTGLLPLISALSVVLTRWIKVDQPAAAFHPRRQVQWLVKEGVGHGLLSDEQSVMVQRVLKLSSQTVSGEMVPWSKVTCMKDDAQARDIWELANRTSYSRLPVLDGQGRVQGVLRVRDALLYQQEDCPEVRTLMTPVMTLDLTMPLRVALAQMQTKRAALAVVTQQDKPVGMVTIKDLVEPITGELMSW